jgi:hypothetical protein
MTSRRFPLRRVLVIALVVLAVFAGVVLRGVYRPLVTRGPGVVSASAADFTLPDATGKPVALSTLLAHGPAVLVFYRGFW